MEFFTPQFPEAATSLGMALVMSSNTPLLLLDADLIITAASESFCRTFALNAEAVVGTEMFLIGAGEWNFPQLRSLLLVTAAGDAEIDAYEMDLVRPGHADARLVVNAHRLNYVGAEEPQIVLAIADITAARLAEKLKDDLVHEKNVLFQELQHRVANSLQIIASVLMQGARKVQSDESRVYLRDAHHRVMSIATLQRQLAAASTKDVALRPYFIDLCRSIGASMIGDPERLSLVATVDDSVTSADVSVSLGLIVTELVINALKHAFPDDPAAGEIDVDYRATHPGWQLTVSDNGVGMPGDHAVAKPGLGTGIVDALSKQLGAVVSITDTAPGTRVSVIHD